MPVDNATLDRYIADVAGDDQELATTLRERLGRNEKAATNFVGGFLRTQDYTKKTQDLATERGRFEAAQTEYESRLSQAEQEKDKIMRDLANERITGSRAVALLKTVKEAYGLTDNDLPGIDDVRETAKSGRVVDSTPDLDTRLGSFKAEIMKEITNSLIPEISGLAILGPVWNDISYEHEQLFGKRLTKAEQSEILADARKGNKSLESVWQDKYGVSDKRLEVRDNTNKDKWRQEWNDEQAKKNQEAALRGVTPDADTTFSDRQSPIFKRSFTPKAEESGTPPAHLGDAVRERTSGAERAAAKFIERQRSGQLGKPIERKTA